MCRSTQAERKHIFISDGCIRRLLECHIKIRIQLAQLVRYIGQQPGIRNFIRYRSAILDSFPIFSQIEHPVFRCVRYTFTYAAQIEAFACLLTTRHLVAYGIEPSLEPVSSGSSSMLILVISSLIIFSLYVISLLSDIYRQHQWR